MLALGEPGTRTGTQAARATFLVSKSRARGRWGIHTVADLLEAHSYQYTFAPNPNWTSFYAPAHEIRGYLEDVVTKFSVDRFIKCSHKVVEAQWDDKKAKW